MSNPNPSNLNDLREILFDTLKSLRDPKAPMDIERARAINDTAQVIVNTAKAEVDYIRATGSNGSGFIASDEQPTLPSSTPATLMEGKTTKTKTQTGIKTVTPIQGGNITRHQLK